ncbi:SGNH/GDSL hydrolase family protein [Anaerosporobacter faecicola]|uniref:SGNH/GDSL hydrolase family protein n=1 Tax=Anaerosporobacter faecicola TaxID=2718714 RepID=UPI001A9B0624|nr:SGNH/GDSL hydrolase family protein [Anaerosporobacter faecicola]
MLLITDKPFTKTFRTYLTPREYGTLTWRFWHTNTVDSTWDDGSVSKAGQEGGTWTVLEACISDGGRIADGTIEPNTSIPIIFAGKETKTVEPGEAFFSDEVTFTLEEGHYLVFTWTIQAKKTGYVFPYNTERCLMSTYIADGLVAQQCEKESFVPSDNMVVLPHLFAIRKKVTKKICFMGDSITQGVNTKKDANEYWVYKIGEKLPKEFGIWNIGSGWSRAYDAAQDGSWLNKAKQNDEVILCFGVNDIGTGKRTYEQLLQSLTIIVEKLWEANPHLRVLLFTVPSFNFVGEEAKIWRKINETIKTEPPKGVEHVFDIASILALPAPNDTQTKGEYQVSEEDCHPNGKAGTVVAEAFLKWYSQLR